MQNHKSEPNTRTPALFFAAAVLIALAAVLMCLSGYPETPISCAELPDPQTAVKGYFDLLRQGRYQACDEYLLDFSVADMAQPSENEMVSQLRSMLEDSFDCSLVGESEITATAARQTVSATYLDLPRFGAVVKEEANRMAEELSFQGVDVAEEKKAMEIGVQALENMRANAPSCYVTCEIVIELEYVDKEWKIRYSSDLERMITGNCTG